MSPTSPLEHLRLSPPSLSSRCRKPYVLTPFVASFQLSVPLSFAYPLHSCSLSDRKKRYSGSRSCVACEQKCGKMQSEDGADVPSTPQKQRGTCSSSIILKSHCTSPEARRRVLRGRGSEGSLPERRRSPRPLEKAMKADMTI